jgi:MFS family permease
MAIQHNQQSISVAAREPRNTVWIVVYQLLVRVGWVFKTETVIMPAVLDALVDSGTLRGLLPVLNRGGQSLSPLFFAGPLARMPRKWPMAVVTTAGLAACFGILAIIWGPLAATRPELLAILFLLLYGSFATINGLNQLVLATLQGKLIQPGNRGRMMVVSVSIGSVAAIAASILLLGPWLAETGGFQKIFAATAVFFALAAMIPIFLDEPAEGPRRELVQQPTSWIAIVSAGLVSWWRMLAADPALVRLCIVAACFSAVIMLFPHYQSFARDSLGTPITNLVTWVVVQNIATGVVSLVAGPLADRRGTRIVLIGLVAVSSLTPLIVTGLSLLPPATASRWFWIVYVPLGLNPISLKILVGYALELAPTPADHPRYVSIVGALMAAPFVLSPGIGYAVDAIGFQPVFMAGSAVIAAGAVVALGLPEPRQRAAVVPPFDTGI